jgi:hypothetical protein
MKKLLIVSFSLILIGSSCTKDITKLNEQTKRAGSVPAETLFSNALKVLTDQTASCNVNTNVFRFTVQHWAATTYQDEPQYDFSTRAIPDGIWSRLYRNVLNNLKEAKGLIEANTTLTAGEKANKLAICDIVQVYTYYYLVTSFGNIPYTEALDYDNLFPKYEDAKTVYYDLLTRIAADVAALKPAEGGITAKQDLLYNGKVASWAKFANSLQLRMAMTISDFDAAKAKAVFEAANAGAFTSAADNAVFKYLATTPNTNPLWVDLVQSGRQDMVAGKALLDTLKSMSDPRLSLFFRPNNDGKYVGGVVGMNNTFGAVSKPSDQMALPNFPALLLGYAEVEFLRAEAIERGFTVDGTAKDHYENAIKASILFWEGTEAMASTYLATPDVAYATASGDYKQKIGFQKWIALYNEDFQGWVEIRRLDFPKLTPPVGAKSGFPNRLPYSQAEQRLNPDSYKEAAGAIGGDKVETKLFWDKF